MDGQDCNLARASKIVIAPYLSVVCYETRKSRKCGILGS